ncbi:hypothetical protein [Microvirga sp. M2]|uniref:hypothetical protein n=1 Tax=Microvirga sp. M2 TaxID=3073270 RepID=UPI0039C02631
MPLRFPEPSGIRINWHMVRLAFTTRDGWAYLAQVVLFFGLVGLFIIYALLAWQTHLPLFIITAVWLYLLITWPILRSWIRFGRDPW